MNPYAYVALVGDLRSSYRSLMWIMHEEVLAYRNHIHLWRSRLMLIIATQYKRTCRPVPDFCGMAERLSSGLSGRCLKFL